MMYHLLTRKHSGLKASTTVMQAKGIRASLFFSILQVVVCCTSVSSKDRKQQQDTAETLAATG